MESLGKKRKYCRFHPKIDVDLIKIFKKFKPDDSKIGNAASNSQAASLINGLLSLSPIQNQGLRLYNESQPTASISDSNFLSSSSVANNPP